MGDLTVPAPASSGDTGGDSAADSALGDPGSSRRSVIYQETKRILDRQGTVLSELRNRANILLTANAVVATIFGASALGKGHPLALEIIALIVFTAGVCACLAVLWPVHDAISSKARPRQWQVTFEPKKVATFLESDDTAVVRDISDLFSRARKTNWATIGRRNGYLVAASILLAAQIVLWSCLVLI
jgi:hypothetical protein